MTEASSIGRKTFHEEEDEYAGPQLLLLVLAHTFARIAEKLVEQRGIFERQSKSADVERES